MHIIIYIHTYIHRYYILYIELLSTYSVKTDWYIGTTYIHFSGPIVLSRANNNGSPLCVVLGQISKTIPWN